VFDRLSTKLVAALAVVGLLVSSFLFGYGVGFDVARRTSSDFGLLREAQNLIEDSAAKKADSKQLLHGAIRGMVRALEDPFAEYYDPASARTLQDQITGLFSGVGLHLEREGDRHKVISVLPNTPAAKAGILSGDFITAVDDRATADLAIEEVAQRIQGQPGTNVRLTVLRGEASVEFSLVRERIELPSVESQLGRDRLGVIEIVAFTVGSGGKVREAVRSLSSKGARGWILDLRGNPGGVLDEAVEAASVFLDGGRVASYKEPGKAEIVHFARPPFETNLPVVVLVDEGSASASEIVAGAIKDRGRGIIVGTQTYGKGSVQNIFRLSDGSSLKLTTGAFMTPSGRSIGEDGITPDISVADKQMQLARARQILQQIVAEEFPQQAAG
jgi:carboxyl-terminal processing protease